MIQGAQTAPEPGTAVPGTVLEKGNDDTPPSVIRSVSSAGYAYIYDTRTGERSVSNRNMLPTQLQKKREDGSRVFTTIPPRDAEGTPIVPRRGTIKCMLHPDDPNREHYDELGFGTCRKSNLTNRHQLQQHMKPRHQAEWATMEQERQDRERQQLMDALAGRGGK